MTKKQFNELMESINAINSRVDALAIEVENLKGNKSVSTAKKSSKKTTSSKKATTTKPSGKIVDFEPKKDADGNYNYKSWKTCRRNYVSNKVGKDLTKEWMDYEEFCKAAAPFDKKYPYIKKSDR